MFKGSKEARDSIWRDCIRNQKFEICVTTYDYVMREKQKLMRLDWQFIIVDEGHRLKNNECKFV